MALIDSLISYWKLDEASGNAIDSHAANTLVETSGTIASVAGKLNNARNFALADTEYFEIADASLSGFPTTHASWSLWLKITSFAGSNHIIISKWNHGVSSTFAFQCSNTGNGTLFIAEAAGAVGSNRFLIPASTFVSGVWAHFVIVYNGTLTNANRMKLYKNGAEVTLTAEGTIATTLIDSSAAMQLGACTSLAGRYFDGAIDECGFWAKALTLAEAIELYNSGNGLAYPFTTATGSKRRRILTAA